ncbi:recombinase family protein [Brevibacterium sp.]|uniref:recombinase family protein n=1 Tax=Brevibacterium sp. TaxID=1701 RepID=UPI0025BD2C9C|nr:recombinase family protein [Brevibacterium sp.]
MTETHTPSLEAVEQPGRLIGYARVSTTEQNPELQVQALMAAGVQERDIFTDHGASGADASRPEWDRCLDYLEAGDTLVIWKLDRAGRSVAHLVELVNDLREKGVGFKTVDGSIDTTTAGGRMVFHIFAAMSQFERELIVERTQAGLAAARAQGRTGGRPRSISGKTRARVRDLKAKGTPVTEIASLVGIGRQSVYRILNEN